MLSSVGVGSSSRALRVSGRKSLFERQRLIGGVDLSRFVHSVEKGCFNHSFLMQSECCLFSKFRASS